MYQDGELIIFHRQLWKHSSCRHLHPDFTRVVFTDKRKGLMLSIAHQPVQSSCVAYSMAMQLDVSTTSFLALVSHSPEVTLVAAHIMQPMQGPVPQEATPESELAVPNAL